MHKSLEALLENTFLRISLLLAKGTVKGQIQALSFWLLKTNRKRFFTINAKLCSSRQLVQFSTRQPLGRIGAASYDTGPCSRTLKCSLLPMWYREDRWSSPVIAALDLPVPWLAFCLDLPQSWRWLRLP